MNKYTLRICPTRFQAPKFIPYDEVQHKRLNEEIEEIKISVVESDIKKAFEKAKPELSALIAANFGDVSNIEFYEFRLKLILIEVQ